jgi:hypothetical protein
VREILKFDKGTNMAFSTDNNNKPLANSLLNKQPRTHGTAKQKYVPHNQQTEK